VRSEEVSDEESRNRPYRYFCYLCGGLCRRQGGEEKGEIEADKARAEPPVFGLELFPEPVRIPKQVRAESAGRKGLRVKSVIPGTEAEKAGIQNGDIIYEFNGRPIKSFNDLIDAIGDLAPGKKTVVRMVRGLNTVVREFRPGEFRTKKGNCFIFLHESKNIFVSRAWFLGLIAVSKKTANGSCEWSSFLGPILFDYVKIGDSKRFTTLLLLTIKWGKKTPVVI